MRRTIALLFVSALLTPLALVATTAEAHEDDGITPPPYHWVDPPDDFKAGNLQPTPKTDASELTPTGSQQISTGTDDAQLTINLAAGAIPTHEIDTRIQIKIDPLAPSKVAAAPPDLEADGNAYRVRFSYQPSGTEVPVFDIPGSIVLVTPHPASELLFSEDGKSWTQLEIQPTGHSDTIAAGFASDGYYLAAKVPTATTSSGGTSDTGRIVLVAAITVVLALALVLVPRVIRRRRR